jgi:hypothetical protein
MVNRFRVLVIVSGALALAACESSPDWMKTPDWMKVNTDAFKSQPNRDTVRFESEPPGAEAKTSNGQSCRTPCALALPANAPLTVTFTLNGYQPDTERIELIASTSALDDAPSPPRLQPNPVYAELTPAPLSKPAKKLPPKNKPAAKQATKPPAKPAARPRPATTAGSALAPMSAAPAQQAPAPWPSAPPPQR